MKTKVLCPDCGSDNIDDQWCKGRKLQHYCHDCDWKGRIRTPETKEIKTSKRVMVGQFHGWRYEVFDKYGHILISSRSYVHRADALTPMKRELNIESPDTQPRVAMLWPSFVEVMSEVFRSNDVKEVK